MSRESFPFNLGRQKLYMSLLLILQCQELSHISATTTGSQGHVLPGWAPMTQIKFYYHEVEKNDINGHLVAFNYQRIPIPKFLYDCKAYALYISYLDVLARNLFHCVIFINILSSQQPFTNSGFKEKNYLFLVYTIYYFWNTDFPFTVIVDTNFRQQSYNNFFVGYSLIVMYFFN